FALTLSISVVVSAIVSLTLTPMMCSVLLRHGQSRESENRRGIAGRLGEGMAEAYSRTLGYVLRHQGATLLVTLATLVATTALYLFMPKSFLPLQDTGLISVVFKADPDVSFAELSRLQGVAVAEARKVPEVADIVSSAGSGTLNQTPNV